MEEQFDHGFKFSTGWKMVKQEHKQTTPSDLVTQA